MDILVGPSIALALALMALMVRRRHPSLGMSLQVATWVTLGMVSLVWAMIAFETLTGGDSDIAWGWSLPDHEGAQLLVVIPDRPPPPPAEPTEQRRDQHSDYEHRPDQNEITAVAVAKAGCDMTAPTR